MSEIIYKRPKLKDAFKVSILFKQVYLQTYGVEGISTEFANFITKRFAPEVIEDLIKSKPECLIVAYYKGNPVGAAEIIYDSACKIRNIKAAELSKLYVLERFYDRGVGYELLNRVEEEVLACGFENLWFEVYAHNPRAISFYKRQNYSIIGDTLFPMEFNTYENKLMSKNLTTHKKVKLQTK